MGGGSWTTRSFSDYTTKSKGVSVDTFTTMNLCAQDVYKSYHLQDELKPYKIMRECVDSNEHPNTIPVILALDVTGSMGAGAVKVAQKLNEIMTEIYKEVQDVEFCIMGIGDLAYDDAPIQMSQFESDIRIAEQLDKIYFERGGGGNSYESYTAAWYMGVNHCKLDCWNRGKKGIIITMGDEKPNPYLPKTALYKCTGDKLQEDIDTDILKKEVLQKFDVFHISVDDDNTSYNYNSRRYDLDEEWRELVGTEHYFVCGLDNLASTITNIIVKQSQIPVITIMGADINEDSVVTNGVSWNI